MPRKPKNPFQSVHEEAAYWRRRAHPEQVHGFLERRRLVRANQEMLAELLARDGEYIGYYGTTSPVAAAIHDTSFADIYGPDREVGIWPPKVAIEAVKDARAAAMRQRSRIEDIADTIESEWDEGSVLEVVVTDPQPDPNGNLRWVVEAASIETRELFTNPYGFIGYIVSKAMQDRDNYDVRNLFTHRD